MYPPCSIAVARLKTLSARRKKALSGGSGERSSSSAWCSCEWDERVANRSSLPPPSAFSFAATASASISVDLPLPFSPTKKVTRGSSSSRSSPRNAGRSAV